MRKSRVKVSLEDGREIEALTYVVDRAHEQYAGRLPTGELLRLIRQGVGAIRRESRITSSPRRRICRKWAWPIRCSTVLSRALTGEHSEDGPQHPRLRIIPDEVDCAARFSVIRPHSAPRYQCAPVRPQGPGAPIAMGGGGGVRGAPRSGAGGFHGNAIFVRICWVIQQARNAHVAR